MGVDEIEPDAPTEGIFARRAAAGFLDLVVVTALTIPIGLVAGQPPASLSGAWAATWLGLAFLYYAIPEWRFGTSLGKRAVELRVVALDGTPVRPWQAVARTILRLIDLLPALYLVGAGSIALTPRRQRIGDLAARTRIVPRKA